MNVPPYLEVLPPPQPAPRVEWNRAGSSSSTAPTAATQRTAPPSAPTPPTQEKQAAEAQPSPANASGEPAAVLGQPSSEGLTAPTASGAGAGAKATTATTERSPNGEDQPAVASSPSAGEPAAPGDRPTAAGEEESAPDAAAAPVLESAASSGSNWRGGAPKIKVHRLVGCFLPVFFVAGSVCYLLYPETR